MVEPHTVPDPSTALEGVSAVWQTSQNSPLSAVLGWRDRILATVRQGDGGIVAKTFSPGVGVSARQEWADIGEGHPDEDAVFAAAQTWCVVQLGELLAEAQRYERLLTLEASQAEQLALAIGTSGLILRWLVEDAQQLTDVLADRDALQAAEDKRIDAEIAQIQQEADADIQAIEEMDDFFVDLT